MERTSGKPQTIRSLLADRAGNFGLATAIILPVLLASGGVAMDMANLLMAKNQIQDATDAAALAAASALASQGVSHEQAKIIAADFLKAQLSSTQTVDGLGEGETEGEGDASPEDIANAAIIEITEAAALGNGKSFKVSVAADYDIKLNPMTRLLGKETANIGATSESESSTEAKNALSMFFVLDRSGSMGENTNTVDSENPTYTYDCGYWSGWRWVSRTCSATNYVKKIAALKEATANLLTQLLTADPTMQLVRTGAISYNSAAQTPSDLAWGVSSVLAYVNALPASGNTDSSAAFKTAYQKLTAASENAAHDTKNGQVPTKYIVFMTDGDNNQTSADTTTKQWCDKARTDKIEVYTVAFMAPSRGQALLNYCATSSKHYFPAENASELNAAFKTIGEKASELTSRLTR